MFDNSGIKNELTSFLINSLRFSISSSIIFFIDLSFISEAVLIKS